MVAMQHPREAILPLSMLSAVAPITEKLGQFYQWIFRHAYTDLVTLDVSGMRPHYWTGRLA